MATCRTEMVDFNLGLVFVQYLAKKQQCLVIVRKSHKYHHVFFV